MNLDFAKDKHMVVFGLGKAGMSTVKALSDNGANIYALDDSQSAMLSLNELQLPNVKTVELGLIDWSIMDFLVLSPGVPFTHPQPHAVVLAAQAAKCQIICDIELLYLANQQCKFIGITGTNGKSTTTSLIGHILKSSNVESAVGGNIGVPVLELSNLSNNGSYVIEMSSYQLDLIERTRFNISVWLNITPDHLDRHGGLEGYIKAKKHIFTNQGSDDVAIVGVDDSHSKAVYDGLKNNNVIGNIIAISTEAAIKGGVAVIDGVIHDQISSDITVNLPDNKYLQGKHNAQNIAASYAVAKFSGVSSEDFIAGLTSFTGLPHRMEYLEEKEGVTYINDSKATNAESASKALGTFDNIYWIAGGVAKEGGIESLKEFYPKIKHAYLIGQAQDEFATTLNSQVAHSKCGSLSDAFKQAKQDAEKNSGAKPVVLLSPACASFDQWPNFEARGQAFCEMVYGI